MKEKQNIYDFIFSTTALAKTINIILFRSLKFLIQSDLDFVNRFGRAKKLTESNINKIEKIIHGEPHTIRGLGIRN